MMDFSDRTNCFYWQTDRNLKAEDYSKIFLHRHEIKDDELIRCLQLGLKTVGKIHSLKLKPTNDGLLKGNVNIVREVSINSTD